MPILLTLTFVLTALFLGFALTVNLVLVKWLLQESRYLRREQTGQIHSLLNRAMSRDWQTFVQTENATSPTLSSFGEDSPVVRGMSDQVEMARSSSYQEGLGEWANHFDGTGLELDDYDKEMMT